MASCRPSSIKIRDDARHDRVVNGLIGSCSSWGLGKRIPDLLATFNLSGLFTLLDILNWFES